MKKILYLIIIGTIVVSSCKKQQQDPVTHQPPAPAYLTDVQAWLKAHMAAADYNSIDFMQYHLSNDVGQAFVRIAIKNKPLASDFLLIQTDAVTRPRDARLVHIETAINKDQKIDGFIRLTSLDGKTNLVSAITGGYIEAWHAELFANNTKAESHAGPSDMLPEVIVYAYRPSQNAGYVFDTYMSMMSMFAGGKGSTTYPGATLYSHVDVNAYTGGGGSSSTGTSTSSSLSDNHADYYANIESSPSKPGIDLNAWLKCFTDIPDAGATCSITICADLPVDGDPTANVNLYTGATGHCFMELKKTNGAQSVTQVIGFTAQDPFVAIVHGDEFVPGKLVNNAGHKYNASITMYASPLAFNSAMDQMRSLSTNLAYSITRFDCLDFALSVFNSIRPNNPLILPKMYNTGSTWDVISTGERMYDFLADMKQYGDAEAPNILVGGPLNIGTSHGPCN